MWHKPFPNAPQLFDICATERLFVSQHADFQASPCVAATLMRLAARVVVGLLIHSNQAFKWSGSWQVRRRAEHELSWPV